MSSNREYLEMQTRTMMADKYYGDMVIVARDLTATEAHLLCSRLRAARVPAEASDMNFVQVNSLLAMAVGGARVRVPEYFEGEALAIIAAFHEGAFELDENFDDSASPQGDL
ncbi:MAG: hypothetical protein JWM03_1949 [Rhodocyclales bacterium]|nr:hypothetical protein [Rhodocyclales bacterium]